MSGYVQPTLENPEGILTGKLLLKLTAKWYGRTVEELVGTNRSDDIYWPRAVAMALIYDLTLLSAPQTSELFGRDEHKSVLCAIKNVRDRMETEPHTREQLVAFQSELLSKYLIMRKKIMIGKPLLVCEQLGVK